MNTRRLLPRLIGIACVLWLLVGCSLPAPAPTAVPRTVAATPTAPTPTAAPADEPRTDGLSDEQVATLSSLEQLDDHPLYTMRYYGAYQERVVFAEGVQEWMAASAPAPGVTALPCGILPSAVLWSDCGLIPHGSPPAWACSLFAALGEADNMLYGRNFDWEYSPALFLFTDPPDGYASVSMVDIAYFGFGEARAHGLTDLPLGERRALLNAPLLPFDGMNEHGLAVGMAAVPPGQMRSDPGKETIGSLMAIRQMLDQARNVDEAVAILESYNIDMGGGPPVHYLMADPSGRAVLVEFYQGEMVVIPNETPWHQATNFLRASAGESAAGRCWRYDRVSERLTEAGGQIPAQGAMGLLAEVAQGSTQWSVVYGMSNGEVDVVMGRQYDEVFTFRPDGSRSTALEPPAQVRFVE